MATSAMDVANSVANNNVYNEYYANAAGLLDQVAGSAQSNSAQMQANAATANALQMQAHKMTMDFNSFEAAQNRAWQEYMSNTAHQREVRDLQAAGLNPVLSASGGNGASVGSGAQASVTTPQMQKADHDSGLTQGLVSFLTSMVGAQTQLQASNISALNNLAVADKYNAMTKYTADLSANVNKYMADVGHSNALASAAATQYAANAAAGASNYAANAAAGASNYAADQANTRTWPGLIAGFQNSWSKGVSGKSLNEFVTDSGKQLFDWTQQQITNAKSDAKSAGTAIGKAAKKVASGKFWKLY